MLTDSDRASLVAEITADLRANPPVPQKYINAAAAAKFTGLTIKGLAAYRREGGGPVYHRIGWRCIRFTYAELEQWMDENTERREPGKLRKPGDPTPGPGGAS